MYSRNVWYGGVTSDRLRHKQLALSIARTRHAHINGVVYRCCTVAEL